MQKPSLNYLFNGESPSKNVGSKAVENPVSQSPASPSAQHRRSAQIPSQYRQYRRFLITKLNLRHLKSHSELSKHIWLADEKCKSITSNYLHHMHPHVLLSTLKMHYSKCQIEPIPNFQFTGTSSSLRNTWNETMKQITQTQKKGTVKGKCLFFNGVNRGEGGCMR